MIKLLSLLVLLSVFFFHGLYAKDLRRERIRRNAYKDESRLWPKALVPYTIDDAFSKQERSVIEKAMKDIQSISCIRFKKRNTEKVFVEIVPGEGCEAIVGYSDSRSTITLGEGCIWLKIVLHELLHVLGFFHEHTRPDRDDFVTIFDDNIEDAFLDNFEKKSESDVTTFGLPYDFKSILHYQDRHFAIDKTKKTIKPKVALGKVVIGKAEELSKMDILKLNKLYHCPKKKFYEIEDEGSGLTDLEDNFIVVSK